ncbi:alcohol dehydrogenase class IV [Altererythrobacter atlanticus]|nr:maleylacetate reductase [Croceibacterium atlanticum]MBB5731696.1 alcohol dehydrogenase class IV [Croceibacterium atlanticum]
MIGSFVYESLPGRVVFGAGAIRQLSEEIAALGLSRALVVTTPAQEDLAQMVAARIGGACAAIFAGAAMHTPVGVTEQALQLVNTHQADALISIGGGSALGLSKALALRTDLPQVAIPTTYAGSEMTPILGETQDQAKTTLRDPKVLPELVIYDAELTLELPVGISGTSALNAIAHSVEALYARESNPVIRLLAAEGIRSLASALPGIAADQRDVSAREMAQYGAWLCGMCLAGAGMALHHKLCHTLGGSFGLPHAETHAVVLPHALAYNAPAVPEAMATLRVVLDADDPALALQRLGRTMGAPASLRELGLAESDIETTVERTMASPYWNPRPLERGALQETLWRAWAGTAPASE